MCGIFVSKGFEHRLNNLPKGLFEGLTERGPDSNYFTEINDLVIGQTVLSFSRGNLNHSVHEHLSPDNNKVVLLNGEIYNWKLLALQNNIRCSSDIELLNNLVTKFSLNKILDMIEGMYIIIIYDIK